MALVAMAVCALAPMAVAATQKQPAAAAKVFVFAKGDTSGFVDKNSRELSDSVKDVQQQLRKKKNWLALVDSKEQAHIVLEVLARGLVPTGAVETTSQGYVSEDGKYASGSTKTQERHDYVLTTVMRVGKYENQMVGRVSDQYLMGIWKAAADQVADELEDWVKKNYDRLMSPSKR